MLSGSGVNVIPPICSVCKIKDLIPHVTMFECRYFAMLVLFS